MYLSKCIASKLSMHFVLPLGYILLLLRRLTRLHSQCYTSSGLGKLAIMEVTKKNRLSEHKLKEKLHHKCKFIYLYYSVASYSA